MRGVIRVSLCVALCLLGCARYSTRGNTNPSGLPNLAADVRSLPPDAAAVYQFLLSELHYLNVEGAEGLSFLEKATRNDPSSYLQIRLAAAYLLAGRLDEAQAIVEKELKTGLMQKDRELLVLAAEVFERQGLNEQAIGYYQNVIEIDPLDEVAWLNLSRLYTRVQDLDGALDALNRLLSLYPDSERGHYFVATLYRKTGDQEKARIHFRKALQMNPELIQAWRQLAQMAEADEDYHNALEAYLHVLDIRPLDEQAAARVVQIYLLHRQADRAVAILKDQEKLAPENLQVKLTLGKVYFEQKRYRDANEVFQGIIALRPDYHAIRFYQGVVLEEMEQIDEAIQVFSLIPPQADVYYESVIHRAYLLQTMKRDRESVALLEAVFTMPDPVPEVFDLLASGYERLGDLSKALGVLERSIVLHADNERLLYHLGTLYDRASRGEDSQRRLREVLALNPSHTGALNYLGYTLAESGKNLEEAKSLILKAMKIKPDDGYIMDSLGWVYYRQGNYQTALDWLRKAFKVSPEESIIAEHLADVYMALGRQDLARAHYRKAMALNESTPDLAERGSERSRLQEKMLRLGFGEHIPVPAPAGL